MPRSNIKELKGDLRIIGDKLHLVTAKRFSYEDIETLPGVSFLIKFNMDRIKKEERRLLEDYMCLEQLIDDLEGGSSGLRLDYLFDDDDDDGGIAV